MAKSKTHNTSSISEFYRYLHGEMSDSEQHRFEKQMLENPFLAEAYEGFLLATQNKTDFTALKNSLNEKLTHKLEKPTRRVTAIWLFATAASVLLLSGLLFYWPKKNIEPMLQATQRNVNHESVAGITGEKEKTKEIKPVASDVDKKIISRSRLRKPAKLAAATTVTPDSAFANNSQPLAVLDQPSSAKPGLLSDRAAIAENLPEVRAARMAMRSQSKGVTVYTNVVQGTVVDARGQGVPGVSVSKTSREATVTDSAGNFSLQAFPPDSLRLSFVGYKTKTVPVNDPDLGKIKIDEDVTALSEVVVVGYGTSKMEFSTAKVTKKVNPEPAEGWEHYKKYLAGETRNAEAKVSVTVRFIVNPGGKLSDFKTEGEGDQEQAAIKIVKDGPSWKPGTENNQEVSDSAAVIVQFGN